MRRISYTTKRIIAGVLALLLMFCVVDLYAGFGWLGKYDSTAIIVIAFLIYFDLTYVGPSIAEMEERRKQRSRPR